MKSNELLFLLVVFLANIVQGITGFAGTVLAMPFSVLLIGFNNARPILNILEILSGIFVLALSYKSVSKKELLKIICIMIAGIIAGLSLKKEIVGNTRLLYILLGSIVILIGISGLIRLIRNKENSIAQSRVKGSAILIISGLIHGLFVCGGPLLVIYLTDKAKEKNEFRSTISAVWIVLNSVILIDDLRFGLISLASLKGLGLSSVALLLGMLTGNLLFKKISKTLFLKITFVLLIISGTTLLIR